MTFLSSLNGKLFRKDGSKIDNVPEHMNGKVILVYFSAHWCPPCRGFTPLLKDFYEKHSASGQFEIIFVSSDRDKDGMDNYFKDMADYLALEFGCEEANTLKENCAVSGIPSLVVIDEDGNMLHKDGRSDVQETPDKAAEKWRALSKK